MRSIVKIKVACSRILEIIIIDGLEVNKVSLNTIEF
jgi:hypothetical protein